MPDYRIYEIGQDGRIVRLLAELTLYNDVTAIAYAEQLATVEEIEIWEGKRLVAERLTDARVSFHASTGRS
jgi:hypothetical protein